MPPGKPESAPHDLVLPVHLCSTRPNPLLMPLPPAADEHGHGMPRMHCAPLAVTLPGLFSSLSPAAWMPPHTRHMLEPGAETEARHACPLSRPARCGSRRYG